VIFSSSFHNPVYVKRNIIIFTFLAENFGLKLFNFLLQDLPAVIRHVNAFLNLPPLNDEHIQKLTKHLSFQNMKDNKAVNMAATISALKETVKTDGNEEGKAFIRKGEVRKTFFLGSLCLTVV